MTSGVNNTTVGVIDVATNSVIAPVIPVGGNSNGVAITPDGQRVYVTNGADSSVSVIDVGTNSVIGTPIAVGEVPVAIVFVPALS